VAEIEQTCSFPLVFLCPRHRVDVGLSSDPAQVGVALSFDTDRPIPFLDSESVYKFS